MEFNLEKALLYYEEEKNITESAKKHCKDIGILYEEKYRHRMSRHLNREEAQEYEVTQKPKKNDKDIEDIKKQLETLKKEKQEWEKEEEMYMPSAWDPHLNRFYSIEEYCENFNLDYSKLERYNLVAHNFGHMIFNVRFKQTLKDVEGIDEEFITEIVKSHIKSKKTAREVFGEDEYFDRVIITDVHIGMDTEGSRNVVPLYDGLWNEEVLFQRLDKLVSHVEEFHKGRNLVIDELGDYMDGLFGETTRKGHHLPQNMSDKEAFRIGVKFKVDKIERLLNTYEHITCNSIVEDNHSGVLGYFVNFAVKQIIDLKYPDNVTYNILEKFISHYSVGKHTFVVSHGKDSESLRFGFKPVLDAKQAEKIDQYCKEFGLYNGNYIEFSKGDSHQFILDYSTSRDFSYCNYPAFSTPSNWVKSNFGTSVSGAVLQNISTRRNIKIQNPLIF